MSRVEAAAVALGGRRGGACHTPPAHSSSAAASRGSCSASASSMLTRRTQGARVERESDRTIVNDDTSAHRPCRAQTGGAKGGGVGGEEQPQGVLVDVDCNA